VTTLVQADLENAAHAEALLFILNEYAADIMGGGEKLSDHTRTHLIDELKKRDTSLIALVFVDEQPAGLAICFEGFSTFHCAPLLNIHDFTIAPTFRGRGLSKLLLRKIEELAAERGCTKLTLEVLEGNTIARKLYENSGFERYGLDPKMGKALFYEKKLSAE